MLLGYSSGYQTASGSSGYNNYSGNRGGYQNHNSRDNNNPGIGPWAGGYGSQNSGYQSYNQRQGYQNQSHNSRPNWHTHQNRQDAQPGYYQNKDKVKFFNYYILLNSTVKSVNNINALYYIFCLIFTKDFLIKNKRL